MRSLLTGLNREGGWEFLLALEGRFGRLRHALGCEEEIRRRCIVNGEPPKNVAKSMGLRWHQVLGAAEIFRFGKFSPERLACVVMLDPGMDDEDIAEIFNRSIRWARVVRRQRCEIKREERIPRRLVWFDPYLQRDDPNPEEIARRAMEVRANGVPLDSPARCKWKADLRRGTDGTLVSTGAA